MVHPHPFPPLTTRNFINPGGKSGGRPGRSRSTKCALHFGTYWLFALPLGPSRHGQSIAILSSTSSSGVSGPNFAANLASL